MKAKSKRKKASNDLVQDVEDYAGVMEFEFDDGAESSGTEDSV